MIFFFFSSRRRHTRCYRDWSSDVCSSDLVWAIKRVAVEIRLVVDDELVGARLERLHEIAALLQRDREAGADGAGQRRRAVRVAERRSDDRKCYCGGGANSESRSKHSCSFAGVVEQPSYDDSVRKVCSGRAPDQPRRTQLSVSRPAPHTMNESLTGGTEGPWVSWRLRRQALSWGKEMLLRWPDRGSTPMSCASVRSAAI